MRPHAISAPHEPVILSGRICCLVPSVPLRLPHRRCSHVLGASPLTLKRRGKAFGLRCAFAVSRLLCGVCLPAMEAPQPPWTVIHRRPDCRDLPPRAHDGEWPPLANVANPQAEKKPVARAPPPRGRSASHGMRV